MAAIMALEHLRAAVVWYCRFPVFTPGYDQLVANWKKNNWKTSAKKPVKNKDLWERLDHLVTQHEVSWKWVKAHSGIAQNERVDT